MKERRATVGTGVSYVRKNSSPLMLQIRKIRSNGSIVDAIYRASEEMKDIHDFKVTKLNRV